MCYGLFTDLLPTIERACQRAAHSRSQATGLHRFDGDHHGVVELGPGELIVVPVGVQHRPVAAEEALVLLLEPQTTRNTGEVVDERTVAELEWV